MHFFFYLFFVVANILLTTRVSAHDLPSDLTAWDRKAWIRKLSNYIKGPVARIPWAGIHSLLSNPNTLASLDRLDLMECTKKFREMVAFYKDTLANGNYAYAGANYEKVESVYPGIYDPPPELKNGIPDDISKIAEKKGWFYLSIREGRGSRIIIGVPAGENQKYAQWYNVGTHDGHGAKRFVVAQASIVQNTSTGEDGKEVKSFTPFFIQRATGDFNKNFSHQPRDSVHKCIECHLSGVHDVFVSEYQDALRSYEEPVKMRSKINQAFRGYGELNWGPWFDPTKFGPTIDLDFLMAALKKESVGGSAQSGLSKINCINCHGPDTKRGELNLIGLNGKQHIFQKLKDGSMPNDEKSYHKMSKEDRYDLASFIDKNYSLQLIEWTHLEDCLLTRSDAKTEKQHSATEPGEAPLKTETPATKENQDSGF